MPRGKRASPSAGSEPGLSAPIEEECPDEPEQLDISQIPLDLAEDIINAKKKLEIWEGAWQKLLKENDELVKSRDAAKEHLKKLGADYADACPFSKFTHKGYDLIIRRTKDSPRITETFLLEKLPGGREDPIYKLLWKDERWNKYKKSFEIMARGEAEEKKRAKRQRLGGGADAGDDAE
jgi:hypothetical protein